MKHFLALATLVVCTLSAIQAQEPVKPLKIGVFDSKRLVTEHWKYPQVMATLKEEKDRLDGIYRKRTETVRELGTRRDTLVEDLKSPILSATARQTKKQELEKIERDGAAAMQELRGMERAFYKQMMDKEKDERRILTKDILAEIEDYGKKNGFTLIIDKAQGVAYAADSVMITSELLKRINAGHESPAPEPKGAAPEKAPEAK